MTDRKEQRRRYDQKRQSTKESRKWYSSKAWGIRKRDQRANFPLCCLCEKEGVTRLMSIVDHHPPHNEDYITFFTGSVRSLCKPHHDGLAQADEGRGFSLEVGDDGWPTDSRHPQVSGGTVPKHRNKR